MSRTHTLLLVLAVYSVLFCVLMSILMSVFVISSWWSPVDGVITLSFNQYHERIAETILFPLGTIGGIICFVVVMRHYRDVIGDKLDRGTGGGQLTGSLTPNKDKNKKQEGKNVQ